MPKISQQALDKVFKHLYNMGDKYMSQQLYNKANECWEKCLLMRINDRQLVQKYVKCLQKNNKQNVIVSMFPSMYGLYGKQLQMYQFFNGLQKQLGNKQIKQTKAALQSMLYYARNQEQLLPSIIDKYCFVYLYTGEIEEGFQVILKYEKLMGKKTKKIENIEQFFNSLKSLFIFHIGKYQQCCLYIEKNVEARQEYKYISYEYEKGFLSRCQILLGNYEESLAINNQIIQYLQTNSITDQLFKFYSLKSLSLYKLGKIKQALEQMDKAIKHKQDDAFSQIKWCLINVLVCKEAQEQQLLRVVRQKLNLAMKTINEELCLDKYIRSQFSQYFPNPKIFFKLKSHIEFLIKICQQENIGKVGIKRLKQIIQCISQFFIEGMNVCQKIHSKLLSKQQKIIQQTAIF